MMAASSVIANAEESRRFDLEELVFRRQFALGPRPFVPSCYWRSQQLLDGLYLSVHQDLPCAVDVEGGMAVALIGLALDPYHPQRSEREIVAELKAHASDLSSVIEATKALAGRWLVILQWPGHTYLFTDPCGLRQAFHHTDGAEVWVASQPELINAVGHLKLSDDDALVRFLLDPELPRCESAWIGARTIYKDCLHLMPNHYLDYGKGEQHRFYPSNDLRTRESSDVVATAATLLQGIMTAAADRGHASLAVTAGWDSRVLLAASRPTASALEYYVDRMGTLKENHPDVWVPQKLAKLLGLRFVVRNSNDEIPSWFSCMLSHNVTCARILPKTRVIYSKLISGDNAINLNGNCGEIGRNHYDRYLERNPLAMTSSELAERFQYCHAPAFVTTEIEAWLRGMETARGRGWNLLDLFYWEQRVGNWGAQYPAEQDIAAEEVSPFNCRSLIETLLSSPADQRAAPGYPLYERLIKEMWPEALAVPINPAPPGGALEVIKDKVRPHVPIALVNATKRMFRQRR